jgi:hypothetical protein
MADTDALLARLESLEAAMLEVRTRLAALRPERFHSMRDFLRCPACGGGSLLHFREVREQTRRGLEAVGLNHRGNLFHQETQAPLEAFVCRGCSLVEWHVLTLEGVEADGAYVVAYEQEPGAPDAGPFR